MCGYFPIFFKVLYCRYCSVVLLLMYLPVSHDDSENSFIKKTTFFCFSKQVTQVCYFNIYLSML